MSPLPQALQDGAEHADVVQAVVLEELRIFGIDEGIDNHARNPLAGDDGAPLFKDLAD